MHAPDVADWGSGRFSGLMDILIPASLDLNPDSSHVYAYHPELLFGNYGEK